MSRVGQIREYLRPIGGSDGPAAGPARQPFVGVSVCHPHCVFLRVEVSKPAFRDPLEAALSWTPWKADMLRRRGRLLAMDREFIS